MQEQLASLQVKDCNGVVKVLQRLSVNEAKRTLGVRIAPDGNNRAEIEFFMARVRDGADRIRTGHFPRHLVWESMTTTIMKSIQSPLAATTLVEKECDAIMRPLLQAALPASGIVRTIPRALVFGPK